MVSNEKIKRRLELRRRGINPDEGLNKENEVICSKCQAVNLENAKFCISCGNSLEISNESIEDVNSFNTEMNNEKEVYLTIKDGNSHDEKIYDKQKVQLDAESKNAPDKEMEDILEQPAEVNILDEIKKAKELLDMGAISQEEYEIIKSKYLDLLN